jgi:hypothetical protein
LLQEKDGNGCANQCDDTKAIEDSDGKYKRARLRYGDRSNLSLEEPRPDLD